MLDTNLLQIHFRLCAICKIFKYFYNAEKKTFDPKTFSLTSLGLKRCRALLSGKTTIGVLRVI